MRTGASAEPSSRPRAAASNPFIGAARSSVTFSDSSSLPRAVSCALSNSRVGWAIRFQRTIIVASQKATHSPIAKPNVSHRETTFAEQQSTEVSAALLLGTVAVDAALGSTTALLAALDSCWGAAPVAAFPVLHDRHNNRTIGSA